MRACFPCIKVVVFDIDFTLYRHDEYYQSQGRLLVEKYAEVRNQALDETVAQFARLRLELGENGKKASYTLTLESLGISLQEQCKWKNLLFEPEAYLERDEKLVQSVRQLSAAYKLFAFTNNTRQVASRTLEILGVDQFFDEVWGSEDIGEPKPTILPYKKISEMHGIPMHAMVTVGDRYQVDLLKPVEHGVAGILVESMSDTYDLPRMLSVPASF